LIEAGWPLAEIMRMTPRRFSAALALATRRKDENDARLFMAARHAHHAEKNAAENFLNRLLD
jgi:hypothetical protein